MQNRKKMVYLSNGVLDNRAANSIHVMRQCAAFSKMGYDVTLFAVSNENEIDVFPIYGCEKTFKLKTSNRANIRYISPISYAFRQIVKLRSDKRKTICYGRCPILSFLALLKGYDVIFEAHELPHNLLLSYLFKYILNHSKLLGLVCISRGLYSDIDDKYKIDKATVSLIAHDGADMPASNQEQVHIFDNPLSRKVVGYAGGLRVGNGVELILRLAGKNPDYLFVLAGGEEFEIKAWQEKFDFKNIIWLGKLEPRSVFSFLKQCDILVAPYQPGPKTNAGRDTGRWMSPLKLFEYMAAEKPIIISDFPVLREVVSDNELRLLPPEELDTWHATLNELIYDDVLSSKLAQSSYELLVRNYTWEKRARLISDKFV